MLYDAVITQDGSRIDFYLTTARARVWVYREVQPDPDISFRNILTLDFSVAEKVIESMQADGLNLNLDNFDYEGATLRED